VRFTSSGRRDRFWDAQDDFHILGQKAVRAALKDARLSWKDIGSASSEMEPMVLRQVRESFEIWDVW